MSVLATVDSLWNSKLPGVLAGPILPPGATVTQQIVDVAQRHGSTIAVEDRHGRITYAQLLAAAMAISEQLRGRGVRPGDVVGIRCSRDRYLPACALAVTLVGAAYLPLDAEIPTARVDRMLRMADVSVVVAGQHDDAATDTGSLVVGPDAFDIALPAGTELAARNEASVDRAAYVIFTSGSSGLPKGISVRHASLANLVSWHRSHYGQEHERVLIAAGMSFDASVWEIWSALVTACTLVFAPREIMASPVELKEFIVSHEVQSAFLSTPVAQLFMQMDSQPSTLKRLLTGGDRLHEIPADLPYMVFNNYGPSECTVVATATARLAAMVEPSIGSPVANTLAVVVDENGLPVAQCGTTGQLVIAGAAVSAGYLGDADQGRVGFGYVVDAEGATLPAYMTGDFVSVQDGGELSFVGRLDRQVKLRGQRIELDEVQGAFLDIPGVMAAAVSMMSTPAGEARLCAMVATDGVLQPKEIRHRAGTVLPAVWVPSVVVVRAALPLTANGKVDYDAVSNECQAAANWSSGLTAATSGQPQSASRDQPPRQLSDIFCGVLGAPAELEVPFFDHGGDSLMAAQLVARVRGSFGVDLKLVEFLAEPTMSALWALVHQRMGQHNE